MRRINCIPLALRCFAALTTSLFGGPVAADVIRQDVAPGVLYIQEVMNDPSGPLVFNTLRVDLKRPGVRVKAELAQDVVLADGPLQGREAVGLLAARHHAVAAVNADFFPFTGDPLNLGIRDGELFSESMPHRSALGIGKDGSIIIDNLLTVGTLWASDGSMTAIDGINRPVSQDELILLTPTYGSTLRCSDKATVIELADVALPVRAGQDLTGKASELLPGDPKRLIKPNSAVLVASAASSDWLKAHVHSGDTLRVRFDLVSNPLPPGTYRGGFASRAGILRGRAIKSAWLNIQQAVGGGPWLVRDGKVAIDVDEEKIARDVAIGRAPRTAAGVTAEGQLLLVTVDGRQPHSRGVSLVELADYLVKQGAVQAMNLDGGGSTSMVVRNLYVNGPSDGEPRAIADALAVYVDEPIGQPQLPAADTLNPLNLKAGEIRSILLPLMGAGPNSASRLFGTAEGKAFVSQSGFITGSHAGSGLVVVKSSAGDVRVPYTIEPGPPAKLTGTFSAAPNNPPDRSILTIRVTDSYDNGIADQAITIKAGAGLADADMVKTDKTGRATVEIVWDSEQGRQVTATARSLAPLVLQPKK